MKYFTPELYVLGNSSDPDAVDRADEEWDVACDRYHAHLTRIEPSLPDSVRRFCRELSLHDADVFAPAVPRVTRPGDGPEITLVTQNVNTLIPEYLNTLITLSYGEAEVVRFEKPVDSEVFRQVQPIWLYDEFDVVEPGRFEHRIFISTGRVLAIHFRSFRYHVANLVGRLQDRGLKTAALAKAASA